MSLTPTLLIGEVVHTRARPAAHTFAYPIFNVSVPIHALSNDWPGLALDRLGWASFFMRDHGARDGSDLAAWAHTQFCAAGIQDIKTVELICLPRIVGFVFNPVSFWVGRRDDNAVWGIIAEVNNTFGERLSYVLAAPSLRPIRNGETLHAKKRLHVSPFNRVTGEYQFRFHVSDEAFLARIDYDDNGFAHLPLLSTHIRGTREPLTRASMRHALWRLPFLTLQVVLKIHWQALRLWLKRVPFLGYLPSDGKK